VGIWNTLFGISIFFVFSNFLPSWPNYMILLMSYPVSITQSHFSQRNFVWASGNTYIHELMKFSAGYWLQFILNLLLLEIGVKVFSLDRNICQVFITLLLIIFSFFVNKNYVFAEKA
jgi:putative flippase GtrA